MYYDIVKSGERINGLRTARRMTRQQLAEHIGLSVDALRKIETGVNGAKIDTLVSIADVFEVSLDYLVSGSERKTDTDSLLAGLKENGIQFLLKIFIPEELPVNQCDLGVVLGNALDNAIEATEKCNENNKNIEIAMGIKKQSLVLVIKNPYEGSLKQDKSGKLISTKNDFRRHGYGISSIQKVADKYGGDVIIETQDGKFVLTVMMNIGEFNS